jgi:hypothetical protein
MGSFSYLYIGSKQFSWRSLIPPVACLLFDEIDYKSRLVQLEPDEVEESQSSYLEHVLVTTCGEARRRLERLGIVRNLLREIHFTYFGFNFGSYVESLDFRVVRYLRAKHGEALDDRYTERFEKRLLRRVECLSHDEEFERVLSASRCEGNSADYLARLEAILKELKQRGPEDRGSTAIDSVKFHRDFLLEFLHEDHYVDPQNELEESAPFDIATLYSVGLCVFASDQSVPVELNFGELVQQEEPLDPKEISEMLLDNQRLLAIRTSHAQAAFGALAIRPSEASAANPSEQLTARTRTTREKGDILEKSVVEIFSQEHGFGVRNKYHRGDEEIDLVIINRQPDPFWQGLQSPVIIAECRNRLAKVRARDLREFEVKLRNSGHLCRLGLMVSTSGFTRECSAVIKRLSREGYRIILIDQKSLNHRLAENVSTKDWLETLILDQF